VLTFYYIDNIDLIFNFNRMMISFLKNIQFHVRNS